MDTLSYATLEKIGYDSYLVTKDAPEKVLQFGEGNFLRAFVDRYVDLANEATGWNGRVVLVQPRGTHPEAADAMNAADGLYTVLVRGNEGGATVDEARVISSCSRCLNPYRAADYAALMEVATSDALELVVSNTTEAGIAYDASCRPTDEPPASFPAKLAQVLHARWGAGKPGVVVLSCELIDHNGAELLRIVKRHAADWGWGPAFSAWLERDCAFCTTLVDSIVPGRIRDASEAASVEERLGYADPFLVVREPFQMWGIEGSDELAAKLPFVAAGLPGVFVTPDVTPYKKRKVRILNGAHTGFVPAAWLAGLDIVRDCMHDTAVRSFMDAMLQREVIPTLAGELDRADLEAFAAAVADRFDNPFIDHALLSICLNSTAKWAARDLPTLLDYVEATGALPPCLTMSLAALIAFYTTGLEGRGADGLHLRRPDGTAYVASDDASVLDFYEAHTGEKDEALVAAALANEGFWGRDLTAVPGLAAAVVADLALIREKGAHAALASCR